ncbi:hypothetical protein BC628DRAFT_827287 [Trametes gibbosa]|nr:hypothetical protein BC628DRAFT_827287 [Trametes gibbosa]
MQNQWNVSSRKPDWSLLSADSIFKGESQEELRRDIALLTVAARGHICGEPKPAVRKDVSPKERLESRLLLHVATLLSTAGSSTVVSGFLEPDNVVIVCARDERPASVNGPAPEMPKIERVAADVEASKRLVDNWYRQPVEREPDLDERLRELCAIMAFYIRTPPEDRRSGDVAK